MLGFWCCLCVASSLRHVVPDSLVSSSFGAVARLPPQDLGRSQLNFHRGVGWHQLLAGMRNLESGSSRGNVTLPIVGRSIEWCGGDGREPHHASYRALFSYFSLGGKARMMGHDGKSPSCELFKNI